MAGVVAYAAARPPLALCHELIVYGTGWLLSGAMAWLFVWEGLNALPLDPVYTHAAIGYVGGAHPVGVAVAGNAGAWLHALNGFWLPPELVAPGAKVSAVFATGTTLLGRSIAVFVADVCWVTLGLLLVARGGLRRPAVAIFGGLLQAHVVVDHLWREPLSADLLEAMGVPFAVANLLGRFIGPQPWFTTSLATLPPPWPHVIGGLAATAGAYLIAGSALGLPALLRRWRRPWRRPADRWRLPPQVVAHAGLAALAFTLALSPLDTLAEAESAVLPERAAAARIPDDAGAIEPEPPRPAGSPVTIAATAEGYQYVVNGRPRVIRGMGYNPRYAALDPAERARRYDRDFAAMRQAGVNTIEGWFESEFDELTLDKAAEHGLGVLLPFELNQDLDYADPSVRERLTSEMLALVARYQSHPALRMWAPGNENLHRTLFPNWVSFVGDPAHEARAAAFAEFYRGLIDAIHAADPNHPVIYRDAEEVYLDRFKAALARDPRPRPWLVYGTNVYSARLETILREWPARGLPTPIVVSEFAPSGVGASERPGRFRELWGTIRRYPSWVLGGLVYTWCTEGPEELDRVFGLVNGRGQPKDPSLDAIGELYRADRRASGGAAPAPQ